MVVDDDGCGGGSWCGWRERVRDELHREREREEGGLGIWENNNTWALLFNFISQPYIFNLMVDKYSHYSHIINTCVCDPVKSPLRRPNYMVMSNKTPSPTLSLTPIYKFSLSLKLSSSFVSLSLYHPGPSHRQQSTFIDSSKIFNKEPIFFINPSSMWVSFSR